MRSLRTKLVLIMVLLIVALMAVAGSFLLNGVGSFYLNSFYEQMAGAFGDEAFTAQLHTAAAGQDAPAALRSLVMSKSDLGIDLTTRNVYILDADGVLLAGSDDASRVNVSGNLLTAMGGAIGQESSVIADDMDLAVPIVQDGAVQYIIYILDNKSTVNALTSNLMSIIIRALVLGLIICIALAFVLAQILITPVTALSRGTREVAAGDFSHKLPVTGRDEIGTLTRNFNYMSQVLQNTLSEVENERNKLSTLFLHMTDGVVAFGPGGNVIHFNPAAVTMLGRPLDVAVTYDELFGQEAKFSDLLALKRPQYLEAEKRAGDLELELFLAPFSTDETLGGALVVIHDVTEQRKNEQTRREFVANVSHELRTPLTNVRSYAETIVESGEELPPELRESFMQVIISETDRMAHIVQDLLTLSRFDSGRMELHITRFPFSEAVQSVARAVQKNAESRGHTLECRIAPEMPDVDGDRDRLEQVLMNVISNAIKYTPDGGKIEIDAGFDETQLFVRVQDNGIGIPEKDLPRLFERFYRVDKARSRASGGTGLGLSIAKEILDQHHGEIAIASKPGEGTTVTVTLPRAAEKAE